MHQRNSTKYTDDFFRGQRERSGRSARRVVPLLVDLLRPASIVDVGCGIGAWLQVFREHGITEVCGVDGDYVDQALLEIPLDRFVATDLTRPLHLDRRFDLALSLEVAEHLPPTRAESFIAEVAALAPVVLFSAAIPSQGGTHHVNERWPDYWAELFTGHDYLVIDCLRKEIWSIPDVEWWYAQNLLIFAARAYVEEHPRLQRMVKLTDLRQLAVVHPRCFVEAVSWRHRLQAFRDVLIGVLPQDTSYILANIDYFDEALAPDRQGIPFLERNGQYWGDPESDSVAIEELERLRTAGARFMVFGSPSFWWFDTYAEFHRYLRGHFRCIVANDLAVVFDLRGATMRTSSTALEST